MTAAERVGSIPPSPILSHVKGTAFELQTFAMKETHNKRRLGHANVTDFDFDSGPDWRAAGLALQPRLGLLSNRRTRNSPPGSLDPNAD
jgi:hypothetical protein